MNFFKNGETQLNSMLFITEVFKYTFMIQQWADAYYELIKKTQNTVSMYSLISNAHFVYGSRIFTT